MYRRIRRENSKNAKGQVDNVDANMRSVLAIIWEGWIKNEKDI